MKQASIPTPRSVNPAAPLDPRTRRIIDRARLLCMEAAKDNDPECAFEAGVELEALLDDDELTRVRLARMRTDACGNFDYDHAADSVAESGCRECGTGRGLGDHDVVVFIWDPADGGK